MTYVDLESSERNDNLRAQIRISSRICIAINCLDRRDESKLVEDIGSTNIAGVKYEAHAFERFMHGRTKKSVRVADESYHDPV